MSDYATLLLDQVSLTCRSIDGIFLLLALVLAAALSVHPGRSSSSLEISDTRVFGAACRARKLDHHRRNGGRGEDADFAPAPSAEHRALP